MWTTAIDDREARRDLQLGQPVIITARWILIATGLFLSIFQPGPIEELRVELAVIFGLSGLNFYLHTQLLRGQPVSRRLVYAASAADLGVVSALLLAQGGFESNLFVLYLPALLALSVAFPPRVTFAYTAATVAIYGLIALATAPALEHEAQIIVVRLIMLVAVAFCGGLYWQIEHARRRTAAETRRRLETELRAHEDGRDAEVIRGRLGEPNQAT